jgi:Ca2+-binding RTX toxin-like protein
MRHRIASLAPTLVGAAAIVLVLAPATAQARPTCHGKKATVVLGGGNNKYVAPHQGHGNQVVIAGGGNDYIVTGKGSDVICAGDGDDRVLAGRGTDHVYGGTGNDTIQNIKGKDSSFGEDGNDSLQGGPSADSMDGGTGSDVVDGASDRDDLEGGPGDDLVLGGDGSDIIAGGDGTDEIHGGSGGEDMTGGTGNDRLYGDLLDDHMDGGPGDDLLIGGHGGDKMSGGSGNDWMRGGPNGDMYVGGDGIDTISYADSTPSWDTTSGVNVDFPSGQAVTPDGYEQFNGVENVLGSAFDDTIKGNGGSDGLDGGPGNDKITGGGGADELNGGPGDDTCDVTLGDQTTACGLGTAPETPPDARPAGAYVYMDPRGPDPGLYVLGHQGGGNDDIVVTAVNGVLSVTSRTGTAIARLPGPIDTCAAVSGVIQCPPPSTSLSFVTVWGDQGDDHLSLGGNYPSTMTTVMDGGPGNDTLDGTAGDDILYSGQSGGDVLNGGDGSDALLGLGTGGDRLNGGNGNDQLVTDDVCQGHDYNGGPGFDIAGFARYRYAPKNGVKAALGGAASDPDRKDCTPSHLGGDLEILEGSEGPDMLSGTNGKDPLILGRGGNDTIHGMGGADDLDGGEGIDSIYGDGGFDTLEAQDGVRDRAVSCGGGGGEAFRDKSDPASSCRKLKKSARKRKGR